MTSLPFSSSPRPRSLPSNGYAQYEAELFISDHISFKRCTTLNPASLLPMEQSDKTLHNCLHLVHDTELPWPNLTDVSLQNPDVEFFTDGSSYIHNGMQVSGAADTSLHEMAWVSSLPSSYSAQAVELLALAKMCKATRNQSTNIYTDSRYTFGVCHATGALWKQ